MPSTLRNLFARQEIYNTDGAVCAYELLYREGDNTCANIDTSDNKSAEHATSSVISHLFTHIDFEIILGKHPAFINFSRELLLNEVPLLLPKNKVVIEVLEDVLIDETLIDCVRALGQRGYKIALDDFVYHERYEPLLEIATIVKLDVLNLCEEEIVHLLRPLQHFKGQLLAEKVETRTQFLQCQAMGFDLFQGYFLHKPDLVQGQKMSENKIHLLKLLTDINDPAIRVERIEEIILQVPKLSYRILRLANSAAMYAGKKIESLMDAITQLGFIQIKEWICLLLISSLDDVIQSQLDRTFTRAKMCQSLAIQSAIANPHQAFTIGMLSTLDILLNEPMETLLSKISLAEELNNAILHKIGPLGQILTAVQRHEQADFSHVSDITFTTEQLSFAYLEGLKYCNQVTASL